MDDFFEAQMEIAAKAAERWKERSAERVEIKKNMREGGIAAVEDPDRIARHHDHVAALRDGSMGLPPDFRVERIIDKDDRRKLPENARETQAGRPVARIVRIYGEGIEPQGFGTGFMITDTLLMTNNHVLPSKSYARDKAANFGHDYVEGGGKRTGEFFEFDADRFFVTDKDLDYTIIAVKPKSAKNVLLATQGFHRLIRQTGKILIGQPVNIIQHPMGGAKQFATDGNELVDLLENFLHYKTDTEPGASGSPVFSVYWKAVALHHSGVPAMRNGVILNVNSEPWDTKTRNWDEVLWVSNEGVRISRILNHLKTAGFDTPEQSQLRDDLIADSETPPEAEKVPESAAALVVSTTAGTGAAGPSPVAKAGGESAQTIVHVHGNADVYTGSVVQNAPSRPASASRAESIPHAALEKVMEFDPHYGRRRGYSPHFLRGHFVDMPSVDKARVAEVNADRFGNPQVLDYHHFSLVMNTEWLLMMWSAVNVDYSPEVRWDLSRQDFGSDKWMNDPRLSEALQIDNEELYKPARKFDRGHVVRRDDSAWGVTREEVILANSDTFHWTNCTPQHENFNRSNRRGVWGRLENHISRQAEAADGRVTLFSGPVLDKARSIPHDFGGGLFRVPLDFWKVVVVAEPGNRSNRTTLRAFGFLMEQEKAIEKHGLESMEVEEKFDIGDFAPQQLSLRTLQDRTGINFSANVLKADVMDGSARDSSIALDSLEAVKLG